MTAQRDPALAEVFAVLTNPNCRETFTELTSLDYPAFHELRTNLAIISSYKEEIRHRELKASGQI